MAAYTSIYPTPPSGTNFHIDDTVTLSSGDVWKYAGNGQWVIDDSDVVKFKVDQLTGETVLYTSTGQTIGSVQDPIKSVTVSSIYAYLRTSWSATLDAVSRIRIYSTDATINAPVDFYGVRTIPIATANTSSAILSAFASGTAIASQTDSIGPLNYNGTYMGANHGPFVGHSVTQTAHGKTAEDIGSEWSGPASRKFYIVKIVDQDKLWLVSNNSGTFAQWAFYTTSLSGQTLSHSSGASNTASIVVSADTTTQITPFLNNRSLRVEIDDAVVNHLVDGIYYPAKSFKIYENYSIVNPSAAIDFIKANVGVSPKFNDNSVFADCVLKNVHSFQSNGAHTVDQTITWNSAVNLTYQGVVQDMPPTNVGILNQYVPGVGTINAVDYRLLVDISGTVTVFETAQADWLDQASAPSRMAQITSLAGVNKAGIVVGYSPLTGIGTRLKRAAAATTTAGGLMSAATKKQYPKLISAGHQPAAAETYRAVGYHHVYNAEIVPDATVATWFVDGSDVVVVLDFHKTSALSRVILPAFCDTWRCSLVDSQNVNLLSDLVIDGGGVAVTCTATYGYAIIRVAKKI